MKENNVFDLESFRKKKAQAQADVMPVNIQGPEERKNKLTPEQERNFTFKYAWVVEQLHMLKRNNPHAISAADVEKRREELLANSSMEYLKSMILKIDEAKIQTDAAYCEALTDEISAKRAKNKNKKEEEQRFRAMKFSAEKLYNPELPYHNFEHAMYAVAVGRDICYRCRVEGIPINEEAVVAALLFHDAGYDEDFEKMGFESREAYAAYLGTKNLKQMGRDDEFIKIVSRAILSTRHNSAFVSNEDKAVRAADLAAMASIYEVFLENNEKLKRESEMLSGEEISEQEWKEKTKSIITFYLNQDIHLTKAYEDESGGSLFHKRAKANLERFMSE